METIYANLVPNEVQATEQRERRGSTTKQCFIALITSFRKKDGLGKQRAIVAFSFKTGPTSQFIRDRGVAKGAAPIDVDGRIE